MGQTKINVTKKEVNKVAAMFTKQPPTLLQHFSVHRGIERCNKMIVDIGFSFFLTNNAQLYMTELITTYS